MQERHFYNLLKQVRNKKYFFRIETLVHLELFVKGCLIANLVYKVSDDEILNFLNFTTYVSNRLNLTEERDSWSYLITWYCNGDTELAWRTFDIFFKEFLDSNSYSKQVNVKDLLIYQPFSRANNFLDFVLAIRNNVKKIGINNVCDFDKVYMGFFIYGDHDKKDALWENLFDKTFINFHQVENNLIVQTLLDQYKIEPVKSYSSIISYLSTTDEQGIEMLFSQLNKILHIPD